MNEDERTLSGSKKRKSTTVRYVDDIRKKLEKQLSGKQKDALMLQVAREDVELKSKLLVQSEQPSKADDALNEDCRFNAYTKPGHTNWPSAFTGTVSSAPASFKRNSRTNCCIRSVSWRGMWLSNESSSRNQWQEPIHTTLLFWWGQPI